MDRKNTYWFLIVMFGAWSTIIDNQIVDAVLLALMFVLVGLGVRSFVKDSKATQAQRKKELEKQRTLELETQLGFEPLNFDDLTAEEVDRLHAEMEKEKGT